MINFDLSEFLARSTDRAFSDTTLCKVLSELPMCSPNGPWIAGGALRRTLQGGEPESDFDFFFRDQSQLEKFVANLEGRFLERVRETQHHVHYRGRLGEHGVRDIQCIRFAFYQNAAEVIDSFDFTICQFAFDGTMLTAGDFALWDLGRKRLAVHKITFPVATMRRLLKYCRQGFIACKGALTAILNETAQSEELRNQLTVEYVD